RQPNPPVLAIPPRRMAELILANRHFTVRGKTANQRFFHHAYIEQLYWAVDEWTLLGHQMPVALVAMKPERHLQEMTVYWDYGLMAEFCPSMRYAVLGDSDEFLMLELRTRDTAKSDLQIGWPTPRQIAGRLATFITDYKTRIGREPLTLHARELPPQVGAERARLRAFLDDIYRELPERLLAHLDHPQWRHHRAGFEAAR